MFIYFLWSVFEYLEKRYINPTYYYYYYYYYYFLTVLWLKVSSVHQSHSYVFLCLLPDLGLDPLVNGKQAVEIKHTLKEPRSLTDRIMTAGHTMELHLRDKCWRQANGMLIVHCGPKPLDSNWTEGPRQHCFGITRVSTARLRCVAVAYMLPFQSAAMHWKASDCIQIMSVIYSF